jgi:hypothetical protein
MPRIFIASLAWPTTCLTFVPNFSSVTHPLRQLLKDDVTWSWSSAHEAAFQRLKLLITIAPVLRYFDPLAPVTIQCDASSQGFGCCLLSDGHPVAYASRALSVAETRHAQIKKELLSILYACEKFLQFVYGCRVTVQSVHKSLEAMFKKALSQTFCMQRMLLRLLKYDLEVCCTPGKQMYIADILSRAHLTMPLTKDECKLAEDIDVTVHTMLHGVQLSLNTLVNVKAATDSDIT